MEDIRLGVVGTGIIVKSMLAAVSRVNGIKAIAACSRSMERGKSLGLEKIYTSLEDMLKDDDIDAVYIAVPNLLHHSRAKQVLSAGKHCLLEKPFCVSEKEVDDLIALGKEKNLILMETIPPAYGQNIMFIQNVLDRLGRIRLVMSNFSQYSSRYDKLKNGEKPYIFDPNYGGGSLMDINYYNVYLNAFLFGRPDKVSYIPNIMGDIDTSGVLTLEYGDFISVNMGAKDTSGENFFMIEGEKGYLKVIDGTDSIPQVLLVEGDHAEYSQKLNEEFRMDDEVEFFVRAFSSGNYKKVYDKLKVTKDAVWITEEARKTAHIAFPEK